MGDAIPHPIWTSLLLWLDGAKEKQQPCKIALHVNSEGKVVKADKIVEEHVTAPK